MTEFSADEACARRLDSLDPLRPYRDLFHIPHRPDGQEVIYFSGHSLGLQPKKAREYVEQELDAWARLGVEGHFRGRSAWYGYHGLCRETGARLVGARPGEVVVMNSLTVNLHLMLASFYRPAGERTHILMDEPAFPSDRYAVAAQLRSHGLDPEQTLLFVGPRPGETTLREDDIDTLLEEQGSRIALVLMNGVNFVTGQWFDIERIARAAHAHGALAGFDLAHAAGNLVLKLHDWKVDFAVWCSYKYLNSGPGAVGGCFVHEQHGQDLRLPRLAGWWGNDPATRFRMHQERSFVPVPGAEGWQVSNPPILSLAAVRASLELFDQVGMPALRAKSELLTGYLQYLLQRLPAGRLQLITPEKPGQRGCQLSLLVRERPRELVQLLESDGVLCDLREPDVLRIAPVPFYNTFHEVWTLARILGRHVGG